MELVYLRSTKEFTRTCSQMSMHSRVELEFEILAFKERGKPEYLEENLSEQSRELTTNSTHAGSGNRTRVTLVGVEPSPHCAIPCPPVHFAVQFCFLCDFFYSMACDTRFMFDIAGFP